MVFCLFHASAAAATAAAAAAAVVGRLQQAPSVAVEDRAIAAASIRDGRPPKERLTLALSEVRQSRTDVSVGSDCSATMMTCSTCSSPSGSTLQL